MDHDYFDCINWISSKLMKIRIMPIINYLDEIWYELKFWIPIIGLIIRWITYDESEYETLNEVFHILSVIGLIVRVNDLSIS